MQTEILTGARKRRGAKIIAKKASAAKNGTKIAASVAISASIVDSPYFTTGEAAAYIKMSRQFLEAARYRADGSGPPYIKVGRSVRYRKPALDKWMSAHDRSPDEPI